MAKKYCSLFLNQIKKECIEEQLDRLLKIPKGDLNNDDIKLFEQLLLKKNTEGYCVIFIKGSYPGHQNGN